MPGKEDYAADEPYRKQLIRELVGAGPGKLLDLGCFDGNVSAPLIKRGWEVTGLDIEGSYLREAEKRGLKIVRQDIEAKLRLDDGSNESDGNFDAVIWLDNESFDAVICSQVLEHLIEPTKTIDEIHRLLKEKGIFVLSVPNTNSFRNRLLVLLGRIPSYAAIFTEGKRGSCDRHVTDFNLREVRRLLGKKFEIVSVKSTGWMLPTPPEALWLKIPWPKTFGERLVVKAVKN